MEINTPAPIFKTPDKQIIGEEKKEVARIAIRNKRKRVVKKKKDKGESVCEVDETEAIERLTLGLNELVSNPVLLMGIFDMFFEGVPQDIKIQFKDVGIKIQTYFLSEVSDTHKDLLKYITNKIQ